MTKPLKLAFIGYGEVGRLFARQFRERGAADIAAYDILFDDSAHGAAKRAAKSANAATVGSSKKYCSRS